MVSDRDRWRASDADRDQVANALADRYAAGQLTWEEYSERLDAAWSARTWADLDVLFHDLPVRRPEHPAPAVRDRYVPDRKPPFLLIALGLVLLVVIVHEFWPLLLIALALWLVAKKRRHERRRAQRRQERDQRSQPRWMQG
jgi:uncharacterized membrane protein